VKVVFTADSVDDILAPFLRGALARRRWRARKQLAFPDAPIT
jgi:hypothetical protein